MLLPLAPSGKLAVGALENDSEMVKFGVVVGDNEAVAVALLDDELVEMEMELKIELGVELAVAVTVADALARIDADTVLLTDCEPVCVGDELGVCDPVGRTDGVPLALAPSEYVEVELAVSVGVADGVGVALAERLSVVEALPEGVPVSVPVSVPVRVPVRVLVRVPL